MSKRSTPFMFFTKEWQKINRPNMSLLKAVVETGKIWQKMTPEERKPFIDRVGPSSVLKTNGEQALNSYGTPLAHIVAEKKSDETEIIKMKSEIDYYVLNALNNNNIENQRFNIMMFNYFNKTEDGDGYLPAEISVCHFSLQEGIVKFYSTLINPDIVVFGTLYEAQQHSLTTHGLPLPPNALGTTDLRQVYLDILKFINDDNDTQGILPPVYTFSDHMPLVRSCLRYLNLNAPEEPEIRVYSVQYLFYRMKCATCDLRGLAPPKNQFITNTHFERDFFEYHPGLACDFHEEEDRSKYCAQSRVIRWSYMFFDYMCDDLDIKLFPSKHFPRNIKPNFTVKESKHSFVLLFTSKSKTTTSFSVDFDEESSIDSSVSKLESLKIDCTSNTTKTSSSCMKGSKKSSSTVDKGRSVKTLSAVLRDVTKFASNINDTGEFPDLSSKKKKTKKPNSGAPTAVAVDAASPTARHPSEGFPSKSYGKKKLYSMLDDADESIAPSSTISFGLQSFASSSISGGAGRGKGFYGSTISKLSGKSNSQLGASAVNKFC